MIVQSLSFYSMKLQYTVSCDEPESPMNGDVVRTGITQGDNASYFCHPGFTISGDRNRTCQPDGQWSGTQPECLGMFICSA